MNNIKKLRTSRSMKQTELAEILSVSQSTLSGWETGKFEVDYKNLQIIADLFDTTIDYILGNSEQKEKPVDNDEQIGFQNTAINLLRKLPPTDHRLAIEFLERLVASQQSQPKR